MNLAAVMDEIAARAGTIDGLRQSPYPDESVRPPMALCALPERMDYDETYGRGSDRMSLPLLVLVSNSTPRNVRDQLAAYCDGSGPRSIKQVIESGAYTSFGLVTVTGCSFEVFESGDIAYPGALFTLDIVGKGNG